ncbi:aminoglycoside 2'-N-acetyltransferase I [Klenkia marina]|uniref:Aminoglycoside 2'-N-acetyltransferase I n=1 Tax=Klenkia marina TaxID=1960309 RepID=A0A1G4XVQ6_9ACTN|nr:GNAT family N-acetyltransferase [Klenkia marina]SCX45259.1 aminoglycoside 2'-N-acetyltransferase I [Klenkia marina]
MELRTLPTADLTDDERAGLRGLLDEAFADDRFTDDDWGHALGGLHVLATREGALVGHAAVVARQLLVGDRTLRTGYVEAVAVAAHARRQGVAGALMAEVERLVRGGYELGALAASTDGAALYEARGWTRWTGPLRALTPAGVVDGDDSWVYVLPVEPVDPALPLTCDWRRGSLY